MHKEVNHHTYIALPYSAICDELEHNGEQHMIAATKAATTFAADLAGYLEKRLGFFDRDERVNVVTGALERTDQQATMALEWQADVTKRFLPNVEATLQISPIISRGPGATSEFTLRGSYDPPRDRHRGIVEQMLARRLVDATLHTFLRHLTDALEAGEVNA